MSEASRWVSYNSWNPRGPYLVVIEDCDWWDNNQDQIQEWFMRNCPDCRPEPNDTIIQFATMSQYTMWRMAWEN